MAIKVKINFKHPTVMMTQEKYDSYMKEYEKLLQENKDLRLSESHLKDELNLVRQQSEARRKVICSTQGMNAMVKFWEEAVNEKNKAEERAEEYRIALMESDCRVDECEKRMDWLSKEVLEWKATAEGYKNQYEELKAQKEADDKKSEEICTACNELYEDVLAERNRLRSEVARLTTERDTSVNENSELIFTINELQDKWEAEHNLRVEAEKAYDRVTSEAYNMHQQITNLTVDNTRLESKVEELEDEVDACRHNIDGYIEGNRRMRAEYEKKLEAEQDQTKHWHKKYDDLKENYDELIQLHREWGEEIDRLRKKIVDLQNSRSLINEVHEMLYKYLTTVNTSPSTGTLDF